MQAYVLASDRLISPFGAHVGETRIHNRSLRDTQRRLLEDAGCQVTPIDDLSAIDRFPCLVTRDDLYFTRGALRGFLRGVSRRTSNHGKPGRGASVPTAGYGAALAKSELTERFVPAFQGRTLIDSDGAELRGYDLYHLREFDRQRPIEDQVEAISIPYRLTVMRSLSHRRFEPSGKFATPFSLVAMCPIAHWSSLVAANLLGLPSFLAETAAPSYTRLFGLMARVLWRAASPRPKTLLSKFYVAGKNCKIHPSAHIEGATLGRWVRVGPHAVIKGAVIGDRAEIGAGAVIEGCSIGARATINANVVVRCSVIEEEANVGCFFLQLSVVGRGAAMCPNSGCFDFNLRGDVPVRFQGQSVGSGSRLLGACLGNDAFLGANVIVGCGQEIPNGAVLVRHPSELVGDVNETLPEGVLRLDRGRRRRPPREGQRQAG